MVKMAFSLSGCIYCIARWAAQSHKNSTDQRGEIPSDTTRGNIEGWPQGGRTPARKGGEWGEGRGQSDFESSFVGEGSGAGTRGMAHDLIAGATPKGGRGMNETKIFLCTKPIDQKPSGNLGVTQNHRKEKNIEK